MNELIDQLISLSFAEDIGDGDHTTLSSIPATAIGKRPAGVITEYLPPISNQHSLAHQ